MLIHNSHIYIDCFTVPTLSQSPTSARTYAHRPLHGPACWGLNPLHVYRCRQPRVFRRLTSLLTRFLKGWIMEVDFFIQSLANVLQCKLSLVKLVRITRDYQTFSFRYLCCLGLHSPFSSMDDIMITLCPITFNLYLDVIKIHLRFSTLMKMFVRLACWYLDVTCSWSYCQPMTAGM